MFGVIPLSSDKMTLKQVKRWKTIEKEMRTEITLFVWLVGWLSYVVFLSSACKNVGMTMTCNRCDVMNIMWRKTEMAYCNYNYHVSHLKLWLFGRSSRHLPTLSWHSKTSGQGSDRDRFQRPSLLDPWCTWTLRSRLDLNNDESSPPATWLVTQRSSHS